MSPLSPAPAGCTAMGVEVSLVPFSSVERVPGVALGASLGLGAKCDGLGALPLPLERPSIGAFSMSSELETSFSHQFRAVSSLDR